MGGGGVKIRDIKELWGESPTCGIREGVFLLCFHMLQVAFLKLCQRFPNVHLPLLLLDGCNIETKNQRTAPLHGYSDLGIIYISCVKLIYQSYIITDNIN